MIKKNQTHYFVKKKKNHLKYVGNKRILKNNLELRLFIE